MSFSAEEMKWLVDNMTVGCKWRHTNADGADAVIIEHGLVSFSNPSWSHDWDYKTGLFFYLDQVEDFRWPNGKPILPFIDYDDLPWNPVIDKCKSLSRRFKEGTLPKSKQGSLPLPA